MGALCCKPEVRVVCPIPLLILTVHPLHPQQIDFDAPVDLWHFYLLRSVGKGAFGKVGMDYNLQIRST